MLVRVSQIVKREWAEPFDRNVLKITLIMIVLCAALRLLLFGPCFGYGLYCHDDRQVWFDQKAKAKYGVE